MVFWIKDKNFDWQKKRTLLAVIIVLMSSAWIPIAKELFLRIMDYELGGGFLIGHIIASLGLIGAWGIYKRWF